MPDALVGWVAGRVVDWLDLAEKSACLLSLLGSDPSGVVFIAAELSETTNVIDVHKLGGEIKDEPYADKDPATKWQKSHLFMQAVREDDRFNNIRGAYFPSPSGQALGTGGSCLALFDEPISTNIIGSGDYAWWKSQKDAG